jgi:broad specificity phosphatase PhoE
MELILVRHALPAIDTAVPAADWGLSDEGRQSCALLVDCVALYEPQMVVTSRERKAVETGLLIADALALPLEEADGLHEHDRSGIGWIEPDRFLAAMDGLFATPPGWSSGWSRPPPPTRGSPRLSTGSSGGTREGRSSW